MAKKWIKNSEDKLSVIKIVDDPQIVDSDLVSLKKFLQANDYSLYLDAKQKPIAELEQLRKRQLIQIDTHKYYQVTKGDNFQVNREKLETDLTADMLRTESWKTLKFKKFNFASLGSESQGGHLHPLLKVRTFFREILLEMGFSEMPTSRYVESSFWNFDSLYQPQSHPARDMHDTFFLKKPAACQDIPNDYLQRVKQVHEKGGYGSTGYNYEWSEEETKKNLLRTHTTAISSQMLYHLAQQKEFKPVKYFSIDRVFRNEALDATHLAEFH